MVDPVLFEKGRRERKQRSREPRCYRVRRKKKPTRRDCVFLQSVQSEPLSLSRAVSDLPMIDDAMRMGGA